MLGDLMISTQYEEIVISEITLALLQDSGWYDVNYYTGGLFRYGKLQGCSFLIEPCIQNGVALFREFCDVRNEQLCYGSLLDKGQCLLFQSSQAVPKNFQYFSNPNIIGFQPADFCPVANSFTSSQSFFPTSCAIGLKSSSDEVIGQNSVCITVGSSSSKQARCYAVSCDNSNERLTITIGSNRVNCPKEGGTMTVPGVIGEVNCPKYSNICTGSVFCNDPISCITEHSIPNPKTLIMEEGSTESQFEETFGGNSETEDKSKSSYIK